MVDQGYLNRTSDFVRLASSFENQTSLFIYCNVQSFSMMDTSLRRQERPTRIQAEN